MGTEGAELKAETGDRREKLGCSAKGRRDRGSEDSA